MAGDGGDLREGAEGVLGVSVRGLSACVGEGTREHGWLG